MSNLCILGVHLVANMPNDNIHSTIVTFASPGARPPVFVAGAFTTPPWEPSELEAETEHGEYKFHKQFEVKEGRWQYKFRLGLGNWWVCDKNTEIGKKTTLLPHQQGRKMLTE